MSTKNSGMEIEYGLYPLSHSESGMGETYVGLLSAADAIALREKRKEKN